MKKSTAISSTLKAAIDALPAIDIPAKGRIAHHIRTGRIHQAIALCSAGQLFIWQHIWGGAGHFLLEQLNALKQIENLLRSEAEMPSIG